METLQWINEAVTSETWNTLPKEQSDTQAGGTPGQQAPASGLAQPRVQQHRKAQAWKEQWQILNKKEALTSADVASSINQGSFKPHELDMDGLGHGTAGVCVAGAAQGIQTLRRRAWSHVQGVREAVNHVNNQLSAARPDASFVVGLSSSIQAVDQLLANFHSWNTSNIQELENEAARLEEEMEQAAMRVEEDSATCSNMVAAGPTGNCTVKAVGVATAQKEARTRAGSAGGRRTSVGGGVLRAASGGCVVAGCGGVAVARSRAVSFGGGRRLTLESMRPAPTGPRHHSMPGTAEQQGGPFPPRTSHGPPPGTLAPEVVEFERFVLEHGEYGGWEKEDHETFEEILKACQGDYTHAIKVALDQCVGYTKSELMHHASWHMDYMDLLVRKRMAVAAWRVKKDQAKAQAQARQALLVPEPSQAPAAQASAEHAAAATAAIEAAREAALKKELVMGWKARRDVAMRDAQGQAAQVAREAAERAELERAERQHINKLRLELHKEIKVQQAAQAARAAAQAEQERRMLRSIDTNQVAAIARRSAATIARRQDLMKAKEDEATRRAAIQQHLLEQVHVEAPDDPNRVLKGTAAHMSRVQQKQQERLQPKDSAFILHVQHRQTPAWRAGLQGV